MDGGHDAFPVLGGSVQHSQSPVDAEGGAVMQPAWNLNPRGYGQYCSDSEI